MTLFRIRKTPDESYCDLYRRVETARKKIARVTPSDLTITQQFDEIALFTALNALPPPMISYVASSLPKVTSHSVPLTFLSFALIGTPLSFLRQRYSGGALLSL